MVILAGSPQSVWGVFRSLTGSGLLLLCLLCAGCDTTIPPASRQQCMAHLSAPLALTMEYSSEQAIWIDAAIADFNRQQKAQCPWPITVRAVPAGSGEAMQQILAGTQPPDIWSPAGNIWLALANHLWQEKQKTASRPDCEDPACDLISQGAHDTPALVISPVVIAMWLPEAQALGWPGPISWSVLASLSTNPRGWAAYGHPEWGAFKFSHTRPDASNSGLDAVIAENYAGSGEAQVLTLADVQNQQTQAFVANIESSIISYGDESSSSSGFLAGAMFCHDLQYISAAVMYENLVVAGNDGHLSWQGKACARPAPANRVVAIYPKEGTFYSEHPFVIPQASWVTPLKRAAAVIVRSFLLAPNQQRAALQDGFRPAISGIALGTPVDSTHGVDPQQPVVTLQIPPVDVIEAILANWQKQRKRLDVMLILDRSGSMQGTVQGVSKIAAAQQGLVQFVHLLNDLDGLGLTTFNQSAQQLTPVSALGPKRQQVLTLIRGVVADGATRLYDTIAEQWSALERLPSTHIKIVIVLTDGLDTQSRLTEGQLLANLTQPGPSAAPMRIFTLAYGQDADRQALMAIAAATGGQEFDGTPQNIQHLFIQISQSV